MMTIECVQCSFHGCQPIHRLESHLDVNIDIPRVHPGGEVSLSSLIDRSFDQQSIDGYKCIRCSLRKYLSKFTATSADLIGPKQVVWNWESLQHGESPHEFVKSLDFLVHMYRKEGLDQENFLA